MPRKKTQSKEEKKNLKYKNTSNMPQTVMGVSEVPAGGMVETNQEINNPNFKRTK
jgi:hypothetical protein